MRTTNLRELGGLQSLDGRCIKNGVLFRCGHLSRPSPHKNPMLSGKHAVDYVFDLRSPMEVRQKPDHLPARIVYHHSPLLNDAENPSVNRKNRLSILKQRIAHPGGTRGFLTEQYRHLITSETALRYYRNILQILADNNEKRYAFHCTQGKDRTGVAIAVILLALDVPRETIMQDYLKTNAQCRIRNYLIFLGTGLATMSLHKPRQLHQLMTARPEYLNAVFSTIDTVHGGKERFLHSVLGFSDESILRLKERFLIGHNTTRNV